MRLSIISSFLLIITFLSSYGQQEKRLALVIGNANYDKGELKNPVNDARLIASTLDSLDFDVILKENLQTKRDMTAAIREFGNKRSEYDVAFVYYAGHGIQVDDENFLLPTKEVFEEEYDVLDYGISVQNIMRYLRAQTDEVNILILDACRDNPFESNWNTTRSLKGKGLAKIPPPTGSLIAFSTDSGQTAPDGDGENSVYTISLAKNMLLPDTSIDQVFRNVRAEVLAQTDGMQRPVEATQLTGKTFYLNEKSLDNIFYDILNEVSELEDQGKYLDAISLLNNFKKSDSENIRGYTDLGILSFKNKDFRNSIKFFEKAYKLDSLNCENNRNFSVALSNISRGLTDLEKPNYLSKNNITKDDNRTLSLYKKIERNCDSINMLWAKEKIYYSKSNVNDSNIEDLIQIFNIYNNPFSKNFDINKISRLAYNIAVDFAKRKEYDNSLEYYNHVIQVFNNFKDHKGFENIHASNSFINMATIYYDQYNNLIKSEYYLSKAYEINQNDILLLSNLGYLNIELNNNKKAYKFLNLAIESEENASDPILWKAALLNIENKFEESIKLIDDYLKKTKIEERIYWAGSEIYLTVVKAYNYFELNMKYEAISSISNLDLINASEDESDYYNFAKAFILKKMFNDFSSAETLLSKLNSDPECWRFDCKYINNY